ncbi:type IV toxin-antitoxin system AbiEi family antitoxin domain-containing protein [Marvinbryantia sp.]|uniref:type IV toxin-antitoxin system AbiEi family antitoxin domain-containing protein n=1 Tax=Marvinbryantia sp. TaxID=2496532 RepID=UPI003A8CBED2
MNLYYELLGRPVFTAEDVSQYYNNVNSTRSTLKRLLNQNLIVKIRNNLYTCISGETGMPVANRYQIACKITDTAYLSHHTAIEYYGLSDQVYYDVYVASETRFRDFEFDGYTYKYIPTKSQSGVEEVKYSGGVRVTDLERTLTDSIKDMDDISGIEEIISFIHSIRKLDEKKLCQYLNEYGRQCLFQKTGYLLETYYANAGITDMFYEFCQEHIGKSKRYLSKDIQQGVYNSKWKLVVPDTKRFLKNGENGDYDRI